MIDRERGGEAFGRLGLGGAIMFVSAVLLLAFTFLQWFGNVHIGEYPLLLYIGGAAGGTAWQTLSVGPLVAVLAASAVATGVALLRLAGYGWKPLIPAGVVVSFFGVVAAGLIVAGILSPPEAQPIEDVSGYMIPMERGIQAGAYLALAAALGIAGGGLLAAREGAGVGAVRPHLESLP